MHVIALIDDATSHSPHPRASGSLGVEGDATESARATGDAKGDGLKPPERELTYHPLCAAVHKRCNAECIVMQRGGS